MNRCRTCDKPFSRRDVMLRHARHVHRSDPPGPPSIRSSGQPAGRPSGGPPGVPENLADRPGAESIENIAADPFAFQHPFTAVVSGPSGSGKTVWTRRLLVSNLIRPEPQRVIWCYGQWQPLYDELRRDDPNIEFVNGIPDDLGTSDFVRTSRRNLLVLDDLMTAAKCDQRIADLFTKGRHHRNLSVMYLTQNLFPQGKACRDIALNTQYLVLFNNPIDRQQVATLARRVYPTRSYWFLSQFERAVRRPYGYLVVDLKPGTPESDRLRVDIFPERGGRRLDDVDVNGESPDVETSDAPTDADEAEGAGRDEDDENEDHSKRYDVFLRNLIAPRVNAQFETAIVERSREFPEEPEDPRLAQHKAINAMLPEVRRKARFYLTEILGWLFYLEKSPLYESLMNTIAELIQSMPLEDAVRDTVRIYAPTLNEVLAPKRPV